MPPFHCYCRSTTVPYIEGITDYEEGDTRAARNPETGKTEYVKGNLTYPEWKKQYVISEHEAIKEENIAKGGFPITKYVDTERFHKPFMGLVNPNVDETLCKQARIMLKHRNGSLYEDIVAIDARTGEVLQISNTYEKALECGFTTQQEAILAAGPEFGTLHCHPGSSVPSSADYRGLFERKKQTFSTVTCFNGTVYHIRKLKALSLERFDKVKEKLYSEIKKANPGTSDHGALDIALAEKIKEALLRSGHIQFVKHEMRA